MSDIAVAHKDYDVRGGGEYVAEHLARTFDCPLYVGHGDPENQPDGASLDIREIAPDSRWHRLMARGGALRGIGHMMHWRDNAPGVLEDYGTLVTSGNEPLWALTQDWQTKVAYTHSTPRWMYDLYHHSRGFVGRTYQQLQRRLYEGPIKRPDLYVANSDLVARRIEKYWNIPSEQIRVVYPPVAVHDYHPDAASTQDYYVTVSRLDAAKRIDEIVSAFNSLGYPLKIAGKGPEGDALRAQASDNIEFLGYVSEERKRELLAGANAFVFAAANEDFGMAPVESMAAGTPVLGVKEGFTRFQIVDGKNGLTWARQGGHLRECIRYFDRHGVAWPPARISEFANRFSVDAFQAGMRDAVETAEEWAAVDVPWQDETDSPSAAVDESSDHAVADGGQTA